MAKSRDPVVIAQEILAATKFWHVMAGLYIWEFVTTLDYEWSVIRGRQPYRWTIVIYSVTRMTALVSVIFCLVGMDVTTQYNCQVENIFPYLSGYLAVAAASLLIVLRMYVIYFISGNTTVSPRQKSLMGSASIAIWNREKFIIAIAGGVWVTNLGFLIHNIVRIRATWVPAATTCVVVNILSTKLNMITNLVTDIILLLIMLVGLFRLGFHEPGVCGLGHLMWRQGLIWLFLATIAEVPAVVFICLNLSDLYNNLFQFPIVVTLSIAATRIYRSLVDFSSSPADIAFVTDKLHPIAFTTSKANQVPTRPMPLETVRVAIHETYEQHQTTLSSRHSLSVSGEGSLRDKPAALGLDYDVETCAESGTVTCT